jgi:predicted phosphodiesterase
LSTFEGDPVKGNLWDTWMRVSLLLTFFVLSNPASAGPAWLQLTSAGHVTARAIASGNCPQISVDGRVVDMVARSAADARTRNAPPAGQRLVCELDVSSAQTVEIHGAKLPMPVGAPRRIVVLGDTGCRIKTDAATGAGGDEDEGGKTKVQDCNDSAQWPFESVAKAAAAAQPDLVVHVGDYVYRESQCPADHERDCGDSPSGDNWETWKADFFDPVRALLGAAPWIFVRGNHEICKRGGKGWFYYLDSGHYTKDGQCIDASPPYLVQMGHFQAWILDSSSAADVNPSADAVSTFVSQFQQAAAARLSHAWLISHRPVWAVKAGEKGDRKALRTLNATLEKAWDKQPISGVDMVVSGHTHLFELLGFDAPFPPQLVVGNGGTNLAHPISTALHGQTINGATVATGVALDDFGFALIEPVDGGTRWTLHLHDKGGKERLLCTIAAGKATCSEQ